MMKLVKIDKNGTKYYSGTCKCSKCGGKGIIPQFNFTAHGVCFDCGGTGIVEESYKEYTPEYEAKLNAKRLAKRMKDSVELNKKFLSREGFNENGETWVVLGDTFLIKEELKLSFAKYSNTFGWHFDHETSYPCIKVSINDVCYKNECGEYCYNSNVYDYIKELKKKNTSNEESNSNYVGNIGDKVSFDVKGFKRVGIYDSLYGTMFVYQFTDKDNNVYIWKTNTYCNNPSFITGTLKEHSEYKGVKQNILYRCRTNSICA